MRPSRRMLSYLIRLSTSHEGTESFLLGAWTFSLRAVTKFLSLPYERNHCIFWAILSRSQNGNNSFSYREKAYTYHNQSLHHVLMLRQGQNTSVVGAQSHRAKLALPASVSKRDKVFPRTIQHSFCMSCTSMKILHAIH